MLHHVYGSEGHSHCGASAGLPTVSSADAGRYVATLCPRCRAVEVEYLRRRQGEIRTLVNAQRARPAADPAQYAVASAMLAEWAREQRVLSSKVARLTTAYEPECVRCANEATEGNPTEECVEGGHVYEGQE